MKKYNKNVLTKDDDQFDTNLLFIFKFAQVNVEFDDSWDDSYESYEFKKMITNAVNVFSEEIYIDRTYVSFKGSKYKKTFISENQWNALCKLEAQTNFGKNTNDQQKKMLVSFYVNMIIHYIIMCLNDSKYYADGVSLYLNEKTKFVVEIMKNPVKNDLYPGEWQTW